MNAKKGPAQHFIRLPPDPRVLSRWPLGEGIRTRIMEKGSAEIFIEVGDPSTVHTALYNLSHNGSLRLRGLERENARVPLPPGRIVEMLKLGTLFGERLDPLLVDEIGASSPLGSSVVGAYTLKEKAAFSINCRFDNSGIAFEGSSTYFNLENGELETAGELYGKLLLRDVFKCNIAGIQPAILSITPYLDGGREEVTYAYSISENTRYVIPEGDFLRPAAASKKGEPGAVRFDLVAKGESWVGVVPICLERETGEVVVNLRHRDDVKNPDVGVGLSMPYISIDFGFA